MNGPHPLHSLKKIKKADREHKVLLGVVDLYLKLGKPVGSNTLKENGFDDLSAATIRNYFAKLEKKDLLTQQHISGGRIPTDKGYRFYASYYLDESRQPAEKEHWIFSLKPSTKEPVVFLQDSLERLAQETGYAACLCAPRFDHDFIINIKLVGLDSRRIACVLITDFGLVKTEVLYPAQKLSRFTLHHLEDYFNWQLRGQKPDYELTEEELVLGKQFYEELMLRYIASHGHFEQADLYRSGFSLLLTHPEFNQPATLASGLALFEKTEHLRALMRSSEESKRLCYWIGSDLQPYSDDLHHCSVVAIPYRIGQSIVGSIAILGPTRMNYRPLFQLLTAFSERISDCLTRSFYKFKIQYRQADSSMALTQDSIKLLEIKNQAGDRYE